MTDFFAELEGHLHAAARRRARRGPRIALMAAAATAAVVLIFAGLSAIDAPSDPEVAAPGPPATASSCAEPPRAVLDRFAVLRREATAADRAPEVVLKLVDRDFPGIGRPEKVFPEAGRLAREVADRRFWLFPVGLEECAPGLCWVQQGALDMSYCHALAELRHPTSMIVDEGSDPSASAIVPDGARATGFDGDRPVEGTTEGNVFFARGATDVRDGTEPEEQACGAPALTTEEPAPELLEIVPDLRDGPLRMSSGEWHEAMEGQPVILNVHAGRSYGTHEGLEIFAVAYLPLPQQCGGDLPTEAGACLVETTGGASTCFPGTRIGDGRALVYDDDARLAYALVPAGTKRATIDGKPMTVDGNFAHLVTDAPSGEMELTR